MTPETEVRITKLYPTHSGAEIAELLGIGIKAVYTTTSRLGLKKTREWIAERARLRTADPAHGGRAHSSSLAMCHGTKEKISSPWGAAQRHNSSKSWDKS